MPLHFTDAWNDRGTVGGWRLHGEPAFAESRALELLMRDLRRYVAEEIAGRSVLVAGHRGAGKTATVTQPWRILRNDILRTSETEPALGRRGRLQRPLLVKLVGESLIAPPPELKPSERKPGTAAQSSGEGAASGQAGGSPPPSAGTAPEKPRPPHDPVESALVHITISLYRALAAEVAEGFAVHAAGPARDRRDRMELAAQLALELDGTPDPATLRRYWERLGRLADGVLWPPDADSKLRELGLSGQGYRELIAVATAAQAFQVCSGAVTYSETSHESAKKEATATTTVDIKDLISKVGALGAGALAGGVVGAANGLVPGVGTGLVVWLLSGAVMSWTGIRSRKSDRAVDYTFLRDRSIQTLDRDLPLVIGRIREAGLAPVFVIDELDKLKDPAATITALIKRLKHLVSDYGFFCFLTDRNYFDAIETKVSDEAYPPEHTYFGERVLILNRPQDLFAYVYKLIGSTEPDFELRAAVLALAVMFRSKLNFSDLNREINQFINPDNSVTVPDLDLTSPGRLRLEATIQLAINEVLSSDDVAERFRTDLGFAQLAIDALYHIVRRWQKDSDAEIELNTEALNEALLDRRRLHRKEPDAAGAAPRPAAESRPDAGKAEPADPAGSAPPPPPPPAATDSEAKEPAEKEPAPISPPDQRELAGLVRRLAGYLADFESLKRALAAHPATPAQAPVEPRVLAQIVIDTKPGMIAGVGDPAEARFRFVIDELARDRDGEEAPQPEAAAPTGPAPEPAPEDPAVKPKRKSRPGRRKPRAEEPDGQAGPPVAETPALPEPAVPTEPRPDAGPLLAAVSALVTSTRVSLGDLVACRLLPETVGTRSFEATVSDYWLARQDPKQAEARRRAEDGAAALRQAFDSQGDALARAFAVLDHSVVATGAADPPGAILQRIARYLGPDGATPLPGFVVMDAGRVEVTGDPGSIQRFADLYDEWQQNRERPKEPARPAEELRTRRWEAWREQILDFLRRGSSLFLVQASYEDILYAAANQPPGSLFRSRLIDMDQLDWSRAALAALPNQEGKVQAPHWLLFAALAALGFDGGDLDRLARGPLPPRMAKIPAEDGRYITEIVGRATTRPRGALHIFRDGFGGVPPREIPEFKPMLSVGESAAPSYVTSLGWLVEQGLFDEGRDEID